MNEWMPTYIFFCRQYFSNGIFKNCIYFCIEEEEEGEEKEGRGGEGKEGRGGEGSSIRPALSSSWFLEALRKQEGSLAFPGTP